jgi:hypothetical protein
LRLRQELDSLRQEQHQKETENSELHRALSLLEQQQEKGNLQQLRDEATASKQEQERNDAESLQLSGKPSHLKDSL